MARTLATKRSFVNKKKWKKEMEKASNIWCKLLNNKAGALFFGHRSEDATMSGGKDNNRWGWDSMAAYKEALKLTLSGSTMIRY